MLEIIDQGRKIVEPMIVYAGAGFHYLLQVVNIAQFEGAVNVLVGIAVLLYTITKIVDWGRDKIKTRRVRRNQIHGKEKD